MADRRLGFTARQQLATLTPLLIVWAAGTGVLALVFLRTSDERAALFLDPNFVGDLPWWVGTYSELSTALWAVAATSAAFGWFLAGVDGRSAAVRFLRGGAAVSLLLFADGVLRLHSGMLPRLLGVPKLLVLAGYGLAIGWWLVTNRAEILRTRWQVLVAGLLALAVSATFDALFRPLDGVGVLLEDAPQFLGVLAMTTYFALTTRDVAVSIVAPR